MAAALLMYWLVGLAIVVATDRVYSEEFTETPMGWVALSLAAFMGPVYLRPLLRALLAPQKAE